MSEEKTKIMFSSLSEPEYSGGRSKSCEPEVAHHWHCQVGGIQCSLTKEDIGKHMPDFLRYAYQAGVTDEKARISKLLKL